MQYVDMLTHLKTSYNIIIYQYKYDIGLQHYQLFVNIKITDGKLARFARSTLTKKHLLVSLIFC